MNFSSKKKAFLERLLHAGQSGDTVVTQPCLLGSVLRSVLLVMCVCFLLPFQVTECLTTVKSVNKTDSQTLLTTFGVRNDSLIPMGILSPLPFQGPPYTHTPVSFHLTAPFPPILPASPALPQDLTSFQEYLRPLISWGSVVLCSPSLTLHSRLPQSLEQLMAASREDLALCPGLGPQKVTAVRMGLRGWGQ